MNSSTIGNIFKGDKVIWMVFLLLCLISVIEVFSASSALTYKGTNYLIPIGKHVGILLMGVFCTIITLHIDYKYFRVLTPLMLIISMIMLVMVLITGEVTNGTQRWLSILGIQFQPSEIAKGAIVLATAQVLGAMQTENGARKEAFKGIAIVWILLVPLIGRENFSTAALITLVMYIMMIIGRVPKKQIGYLTSAGVILAGSLLALILLSDKPKETVNDKRQLTEVIDNKKEEESIFERFFHRTGTWHARISKFIEKPQRPEDIDLDKDAQWAHANIAIASSNVVGKMPGNSVERDFLSQAFSDFIYAIIIEEMGIWGAIGVAFLYFVLLLRAGRIASRCENNFSAFLVIGLTLLLVVQAFFNMAVAVGLVPVTGQPLPLISKGGTSTIINCIYVGAILSISRTANRKKKQEEQEPQTAVV